MRAWRLFSYLLLLACTLQAAMWLYALLSRASGQIDAVIVPGGGVRDGGELPAWVKARFDAAMRVPAPMRRFIIALSVGTVHRPPPRSRSGHPISEARAGARYLLTSGVDPQTILTEELSLDTVGNAFWARLLHVEPRQLSRLHVVTNRFHFNRTRHIFERVFALPSHASFFCRAPRFVLTFEAVDDVGLAGDALRERERREAASLDALRQPSSILAQATSMAELHHLLHTRHGAYRIDRDEFAQPIAAIESY